MISVTGNGNSSFGHASLRLRKSMQMRIDPFFLVTGTMLETQSGCCSLRINPESISLRTSCPMASIMYGRKRLCGCLTGFASALMLRRCIATFGSMPGMSSQCQAKTSIYSLMRAIRWREGVTNVYGLQVGLVAHIDLEQGIICGRLVLFDAV